MEDKKTTFYKNAFLGSALALVAAFASYQISSVAFEGKNYIAVVNGKSIMVSEFKKMAGNAMKQYSGHNGVDFKSDNGKKTFQDLRNQIMEELIVTKIALAAAEQKNISVADDAAFQEINKIKSRNFNNDDTEYQKALSKNSLTEEALVKMIKDKLTFQKLIEKLFEENIKITEEDLKKAYEARKHEFTEPEQFEASHILVPTEELANKVLSELKEGKSFEELAKQYSKDPGNKDKGGSLGYFRKGAMVPEFEKAVVDLKLGTVSSKPVKTQFGYHIIKKTGYRPEKFSSFEEVRNIIKDQMKQMKQNEFFMSWKDKSLKTADIKYNPIYESYAPPSPAIQNPNPDANQNNTGTEGSK